MAHTDFIQYYNNSVTATATCDQYYNVIMALQNIIIKKDQMLKKERERALISKIIGASSDIYSVFFDNAHLQPYCRHFVSSNNTTLLRPQPAIPLVPPRAV